jgi:purine-binding chemotaxis protein CheW
MDLVEIRKKAKKRPAAKPAREMLPLLPEPVPVVAEAVEVPPLPVVESRPARPAEQRKEPVRERKVAVETRVFDSLAALFDQNCDLELATEEIYLQGLEGKDLSSDQDLNQWLTFALGKEHYALDIRYVKEIIKPREITDIPRVPGFILGIISLRGVVIPIYDLRQRLGLGQVQADEQSRIVVCEDGERIAGLLVDRITQVIKLADKEIEPPPAILSGVDRDFVEGVGRQQGRMIILLDLPCVIDAELK